MPTRAGYELEEVMWIDETEGYGVKPESGTWKPTMLVTEYVARKLTERKEKIGIGTQVATEFQKVKQHVEARILHGLLAKSSNPAFEWTDFYTHIVGSGLTPANVIAPFSLGVKLALATPEYELLTGCKVRTYELRSALGDKVIGTADIIAQELTYGTVDFVSGTATRGGKPTTNPILFSDCDIQYKGASVMDRISEFSFAFNRELHRLGSKATNKLLLRELREGKREYEASITIDFDSTTEYTDYLSDTQFNMIIDIPTGSGGRRLTLSNGRWLTAPDRRMRELDLINVRLTAKFPTLTIETIA